MVSIVRVLCGAVSPVHISGAPSMSLAHANSGTEKNKDFTAHATGGAQGTGRLAWSLQSSQGTGAEEGEQRVPMRAKTPVWKFRNSDNKAASPSGAANLYPDHS